MKSNHVLEILNNDQIVSLSYENIQNYFQLFMQLNDEVKRLAHEYTKNLEKLQRMKLKYDEGNAKGCLFL